MAALSIRLHARPSLTLERASSAERLGDEAVGVLATELAGPPGVRLTTSCTHAIEAAATLLGISVGDEVILPAYSFPSTANPFLLRGARVRFADCDPRTGNVTAESIERCASGATRAVVCMHYGGVACEMDRICALAASRGWTVIEDAAHGLFASYDDTPLGRFGSLGAMSFHHTKNISSHSGGALVINDESLLERVDVVLDKGTNRVAFDSGDVDSYEWSGMGSAWRMPTPLAAVLAESLSHRDEIQAVRHRVWSTYAEDLKEWAGKTGSALPHVPKRARHPAHLFWLRLPSLVRRDDFVDHCARAGVEVARHFGSLPHSSFGRTVADPRDQCPESLALAASLVRLPMHHELSDNDVSCVLEVVRSFPMRREGR